MSSSRRLVRGLERLSIVVLPVHDLYVDPLSRHEEAVEDKRPRESEREREREKAGTRNMKKRRWSRRLLVVVV